MKHLNVIWHWKREESDRGREQVLADLLIAVIINANPKGTPLKIWWCKFSKRSISVRLLNSYEFIPLSISLIVRKLNKMIIIRQICSALADDTEKGQTEMSDFSVWPRAQSYGEKSEERWEQLVTVGALAVSKHITTRLRSPTRYNTVNGPEKVALEAIWYIQ